MLLIFTMLTIWSGFWTTIYLPNGLFLDFVYQQYHFNITWFWLNPTFRLLDLCIPLDTGIRAGLFQQLQPIAHALNESIQKTMEQMSCHSFGNKGKSCKFSGRVFLFPPVKKNKIKRKDHVHYQPRLPPADWKQPTKPSTDLPLPRPLFFSLPLWFGATHLVTNRRNSHSQAMTK